MVDISRSNDSEDVPELVGESITPFTIAVVTALCCSLKDSGESEGRFKSLMPLLITTLKQCPNDAQYLLLRLFNGIYDLTNSLQNGSNELDSFQSEISEIMNVKMAIIPIDDLLFCDFLESFDRLCNLLDDDLNEIKRTLTIMSIRAIRFPLIDDGTSKAERVKNAKHKSWECISRWAFGKEYFENLGEDLSKIVIELIENENDKEKLKEYLRVLPQFLELAIFDKSIVDPKRIWTDFWRSLTKLIDKDSELTSSCIMTMSFCIDKMKMTETLKLDETDLKEIGLMLKKVLINETRRRENEAQNANNERIDENMRSLKICVNLFFRLFERKDAICPVLHPLIPIIFTLIDKCTNKYWGVYLFEIILTHVPEFRDQIVSLLLHSLNDNQPCIRRMAATSLGKMAESNIVELKEMGVESLDLICGLMSRSDARQCESIGATKEAVEAVVKIIQYCNEKTVGIGRINEILSRFLSWLTFPGYSDECNVIYSFILDLIESDHYSFTIEPNANSPRLIYVLTKAYHHHEINHELSERVRKTIKNIANSSDSLNELIRLSTLNGEEQVTLRNIITPPSV